MPIPQESENVQLDKNGKLPDEGLAKIKRDLGALCREARGPHNNMSGRDEPDAHPISAITGLEGTLDDISDSAVLRSRMPLNVKDYGAIGDGLTHPLSGYFSTLAAAQAVYPEATALTDEIDWCAIVRCLALTQEGSVKGGTIFFPVGWYRCNKTIDVSGCICWRFMGEGSVWRNYQNIAPSQNNSAASTIAYTGPDGSPLIYHGSTTLIDNYYVRGGAFENLQFFATNAAGNYLVQYESIGQGAFFHNCYFGGGDKQIYFSGTAEPYDTYITECHFSLGVAFGTTAEYYPNYGIYADETVFWGSQSTTITSCTMRYMTYSHIYAAGQCGLLVRNCTLESTLLGPSIVCKDVHPTNGGYLEVSGCHWESIFSQAYWNGTYYQVSAGDAKYASVIEIGNAIAAPPFFFRITNTCTMTLRVAPGTNQILAVWVAGAGPRIIIDGLGMGANLQYCLVLRTTSPNYTDVTRLGGTYNPTNGDFLVSGVDATTKRQREVNISGLPLSAALWSSTSVPAYTNVQWAPYLVTGSMCLANWGAISQAPTSPFSGVKDILLSSPSDLGNATLDTEHKNYMRGDVLRMKTWRGGTAQNIGYGTRYAVMCGAENTATSNAAGAWFPLVTGPGLSANKGNADTTFSYATNETDYVFSSPLTAERNLLIDAWSFTIPNGAEFRIVRTAAATGPFDLVIKQSISSVFTEISRLKPGQWVKLMCNGSTSASVAAWVVTAFGNIDGTKVSISAPADRKDSAPRSDDLRLATAQEPTPVLLPERRSIAPVSFGGFPTGPLAVPANLHRVNTIAAILGA
jgi:hypothetical protein